MTLDWTPLCSGGAHKLSLHSGNNVNIIRLKISSTPTVEEMDVLLEVSKTYIQNTTESVVLYIKHVESDHLNPIGMDVCLHISKWIVESDLMHKIKKVILQCKEIDSKVEVGCNLFTFTTGLRIATSKDKTEVDLMLRAFLDEKA